MSTSYERPHLALHRFIGPEPGPALIILGAVHGNETCGTQAIHSILDDFAARRLRLARGRLTLIPITNPLAYERGTREGERNLNRWLRPVAQPQAFEDHIANQLCPELAAHDVLLDLHSFHTAGAPFAMLGPDDNAGPLEPFRHAAAERMFAARLGVRRFVDGWLDTYARGTARRAGPEDAAYGMGTTEYMRSCGGYGITLECGRHDDARAPQVARQAILNALAHLGLIAAEAPPAVVDPECLRIVDVIDKYHDDDGFERPWASFDPLAEGEQIGRRHDGTPVAAPHDGYIVFPNPAATAGREWFYLARRIAPPPGLTAPV